MEEVVSVAAAAAGRMQLPDDSLSTHRGSDGAGARRLQNQPDALLPPVPPSPPGLGPRAPPPDLEQPFRASFYVLVIGSPLTIALVTAA